MKKYVILLVALVCLAGCSKSDSNDGKFALETPDGTFKTKVNPKTTEEYVQGQATWNEMVIVRLSSKLNLNFRVLPDSVATREYKEKNSYKITLSIEDKSNTGKVISFLKANVQTSTNRKLFSTCDFKKKNNRYIVIIKAYVDKMDLDRNPYKIELSTN